MSAFLSAKVYNLSHEILADGLDYLKRHGSMTNKELAVRMAIPNSTAFAILSNLETLGCIKRDGRSGLKYKPFTWSPIVGAEVPISYGSRADRGRKKRAVPHLRPGRRKSGIFKCPHCHMKIMVIKG